MFNCPEHGLNCPFNFSNIRLVLNKNNRIGKPFGASAVDSNISYESLDNIRKMFGLSSSNIGLNQLKGASVSSINNNVCSLSCAI